MKCDLLPEVQYMYDEQATVSDIQCEEENKGEQSQRFQHVSTNHELALALAWQCV